MNDEQIDALILRATGMPRTNAFPVTNEERAIFRAALREAARMLTNEIDKYPRMNDLPCVRKMQEIANAIHVAAHGDRT